MVLRGDCRHRCLQSPRRRFWCEAGEDEGRAMSNYVCVTCGVQYAETEAVPERCLICEDERQYVGWGGQKWTALDEMRGEHKNVVEEDEPGLVGITTETSVAQGFAIGQRARLILSTS